MEIIKKELGSRVKIYRKRHKWTQEQFAEIIDIEQASLSNLENGKTYPTFYTICNLISKAGIEPNYLFGFLENQTKHTKDTERELIETLDDIPIELKNHIIFVLKALIK